MSSASKVGEIFTAAGTAFTKLGELTMQLHTSSVGGSTKWTEEDIALMHTCLTKFANEIDEITTRVKLRKMAHLNASIKKQEYENAGLQPPFNSSRVSSTTSHSGPLKGNRRLGKKVTSGTHLHQVSHTIAPPHSQEVTLNMLNASDGETDIKMDYDSHSGPS